MNLILGDSHVMALQLYDGATTRVHSISGATIFGLQNATSQSGASQYILDLLKERTYDKLFIMFGKVDLEWVYPKKEIAFTEFITSTIEKYMNFLLTVQSHFTGIYVMGLHPPPLDSSTMATIVGFQLPLQALNDPYTMVSRTQQLLQFNALLKQTLLQNTGITVPCFYIDITDELIDPDTKICNDYFKCVNDHHLDRDKTGEVWYSKHLRALL